MTLEELNKKRDELYHSLIYFTTNDFNFGWDEAVETLMPEIKRLEKALDAWQDRSAINGKIAFELEEQNKKLVEALKEVCKPEPDGHGDWVADEFTQQEVLDGRKLLKDLGVE